MTLPTVNALETADLALVYSADLGGYAGVRLSALAEALEIEVGAVADIATQDDAETGTDNTKTMTPLRVAQAIAELAPEGGTGDSSPGEVVTFTTAVPFTRANTLMATEVAGALTFVVDTAGALPGAGATIRIKGNGANTPTFAAPFIVRAGSEGFSATDNMIHEALCYYNGSDYSYIVAQLGVEAADVTAPTVISRTATDLHTIQVAFNEAVSGTTAGWTAKINGGSAITPTSVSGTTTRSLVFSQTFLSTDTLTLSYDASTGNSADAASNEIASFTNAAVTNSVPGVDTTAPTLVSAVVSNSTPSRINLTWSESMNATVSAASAFAVSAGHTLTAHTYVDATHSYLTTSAAFVNGETARTLAYTQPGSNKMQDAAGNLLVNITAASITNNVAASDTTAPTVSSATATDSHTIVVVMSEAVAITSATGWSFNNGGALTISGVTGTGTTTLTFTVTQTMTSADTITRTYNSGTGNTADLAANGLVSFTTQAVTNSIPAALTTGPLTYTPNRTGTLTNAGTTFSSAAPGAWGAQGYDSLNLGSGAEGRVIHTINTAKNVVQGLKLASGISLGDYQTLPWGYFATGGDILIVSTAIGGNIGAAVTTTPLSNGHRACIHRLANGTITLEEDRGSGWSAPLYTFPSTSTAAMKAACNVFDQMLVPEHEGFA